MNKDKCHAPAVEVSKCCGADKEVKQCQCGICDKPMPYCSKCNAPFVAVEEGCVQCGKKICPHTSGSKLKIEVGNRDFVAVEGKEGRINDTGGTNLTEKAWLIPEGKEGEKCYSCGGKGYYTQMHGESGSDDFGGEGYEIAPSIHKYPCNPCKGTGKVIPPKKEGWEEEFNQKFTIAEFDYLYGKSHTIKHIKAFIRHQLQTARQNTKNEILEIIEGMKREIDVIRYVNGKSTIDYQAEVHEQTLRFGYNQALAEIIEKLKGK